jgi:hypothetical protein
MVCVSLFGKKDNPRDGNFYCNGNSFGSTEIFSTAIADKIVPRGGEAGATAPGGDEAAFTLIQDWDGEDWGTTY